jgi:hypothetical protein
VCINFGVLRSSEASELPTAEPRTSKNTEIGAEYPSLSVFITASVPMRTPCKFHLIKIGAAVDFRLNNQVISSSGGVFCVKKASAVISQTCSRAKLLTSANDFSAPTNPSLISPCPGNLGVRNSVGQGRGSESPTLLCSAARGASNFPQRPSSARYPTTFTS